MATSKKPATPKKAARQLVTCMDCFHALLHQYGASDPILAACEAQPQPYDARFPFVVEVARCLKLCDHYRHTDVQRTIQQRVRRRTSHRACYVLSQPQQAR